MASIQLLTIARDPDRGVLELLTNNVIGTPGSSMVYQHLLAAEKCLAIPQPYFVSLVRKSKALGTCCFCQRSVSNGPESIEGYYVRYFTFHQSLRKLGDKFIDRPKEDGVLRREIQELLTGSQFQAAPEHLYYAYIDKGNTRSEAFVKSFGFEKVGSFVSLVFSRFRPRLSVKVQQLSPEEWLAFKPELLAFYQDHMLVSDENLFYKQQYFVVREGGEIVAGLQATAEKWRVFDMPGWAGKVMMKAFPRSRVLSKIFHPDYQFAAVEGIYFKPGYEKMLGALLEHVLAFHGVYSVVLCLDPTSKIYTAVGKLKQGFVSKIRKPKEVNVVAKGNGLESGDWKKPVYVSGFDVT
jgi:hypothetical protein